MKKEQFYSKVRVRRRAKYGLGNKSLKRNGCILLKDDLIGKTVVVIKYDDVIAINKKIKRLNKMISILKEISYEDI